MNCHRDSELFNWFLQQQLLNKTTETTERRFLTVKSKLKPKANLKVLTYIFPHIKKGAEYAETIAQRNGLAKGTNDVFMKRK